MQMQCQRIHHHPASAQHRLHLHERSQFVVFVGIALTLVVASATAALLSATTALLYVWIIDLYGLLINSCRTFHVDGLAAHFHAAGTNPAREGFARRPLALLVAG